MAIAKGYRNLAIVSSVERGKDVLVYTEGDIYQCKGVTYDSKTDTWTIEGGKLIHTVQGISRLDLPMGE